jgi:hypothetical protein
MKSFHDCHIDARAGLSMVSMSEFRSCTSEKISFSIPGHVVRRAGELRVDQRGRDVDGADCVEC